jgi:aldehyde dehydrogenase (NAD+)
VLSIMAYKDEADAIRIANDHMFGLAGYVHSTDRERAKRVARQIRAGMVTVNMTVADPSAPSAAIASRVTAANGAATASRNTSRPKAVMGGNSGPEIR